MNLLANSMANWMANWMSNWMSNWSDAPLAKALGWTLLHFVWEGALIALVLASVLYFCRPAQARVRYAVACLALIAMPLSFGLTVARELSSPHIASRGPLQLRQLDQALDSPILIPAAQAAASPVWRWAVPVWLAGVLLFYVRSLGGWFAVQRLRRTGVVAAGAEWQARLHVLRSRLGVVRAVTLVESCLAEVPVVIGFLRPVILAPVGLLAGLRTEQVEAILLHELAHIRRNDYLVNLVQSLVEGLLFYHPAVWWVSHVIRAERENCCDDIVVAMSGDARGYAATLAALEEGRCWREPALAATGGSLTRRIRRLLRRPEGPQAAMAPLFATGFLLVAVAAVLSAWQPKPPAIPAPKPVAAPVVPAPPQPVRVLAQQQQSRPAQAADFQPYRLWLNQDVAYIITEEERAAFKRLTTIEEIEHFIEQFWLRRDPTPGTAENEFKEEHYRRIAYANQNFGDGSIPGWKTDRGQIYITYGPPDEKESHPAGGSYRRPPEQGGGTTTTFPFEQWLYRYIEGVGNNVIIEFVDATRSGEYRMTMDPSAKDAMRWVHGAPNANIGVVVKMMPNRPVSISIPLAGDATNVFNLVGKISMPDGRIVATFEDSLEAGGIYQKYLPLAAGSYRLSVVVKNVATGAITNQEQSFDVK
jgi:GWxTD domain-containing protein